jgi:hypothetical protein
MKRLSGILISFKRRRTSHFPPTLVDTEKPDVIIPVRTDSHGQTEVTEPKFCHRASDFLFHRERLWVFAGLFAG